MLCKKILIKGQVQGVFFRNFVKEKADQLGIKGWVKNLVNGDVMIIAEVELNKFDIFLGICKKGPEHAKVESVEVSDYKGEFKEFEIRY